MNTHRCYYCGKNFRINVSKITTGENGRCCSECHSGGHNPAQIGKAWKEQPARPKKVTVTLTASVEVVFDDSTNCVECGVKYIPQDIGEFGGEDQYCNKCNPFRP